MTTEEMIKVLREMQIKIEDYRNAGATTAVYYILRTYGDDFFKNVADRLEASSSSSNEKHL